MQSLSLASLLNLDRKVTPAWSWVVLAGVVAMVTPLAQGGALWEAVDGVRWEAETDAKGRITIDSRMAVAWIDPARIEGRWLRVSAASIGNRAFKLWLHVFDSDKARPIVFFHPKACDSLGRCEAWAYVPHQPSGRLFRIALLGMDDPTLPGAPITMSSVNIELASSASASPINLRRFEETFSSLQDLFYRQKEVSWDEMRAWMRPAVAAPDGFDPLPVIFALVAAELPSDGHTKVMKMPESSSAGAVVPTDSLPQCDFRSGDTSVLSLPSEESGDPRRYVDAAHTCFARFKGRRLILDLRWDGGGDAAVRIAALAPVLGLGVQLQYKNSGGELFPVRLAENGVLTASEIAYTFDRRPPLMAYHRLDVLIGPGCASACEAAVIALRSHKGVRLVGKPTFGVPTANKALRLNADYILAVTSGWMTDSSGVPVVGRIKPDVRVEEDALAWVLDQARGR